MVVQVIGAAGPIHKVFPSPTGMGMHDASAKATPTTKIVLNLLREGTRNWFIVGGLPKS